MKKTQEKAGSKMDGYLLDVAAGRAAADLVLKNAQVLNVFTRRFIPADVALAHGRIAGVGHYSGPAERDCTGLYVCPGFVDAHLHIESSMATPFELAKAVLPWGTTTLVADPHEIVNVCGAAGVSWLLRATEDLPLNVYVMLPSSVPATPFETSGAAFTAADMAPFLGHPRVLGLGEVMCYPAVVAGESAILEKLAAARAAGKMADGHAPHLSGAALQAYAAAGISTEHECTGFAEAREKLEAGLALLIREGSAAHNLPALVTGLLQSGLPTGRCAFCTDDKHLDDIAREGSIRWNVRLAIGLGMPPEEALCMASWNAACLYGLGAELGAVAPGRLADLVLLDDLADVHIREVYKAGVPAGECFAGRTAAPVPKELLHTVRFAPLSPAQLALPAPGPLHCIGLVPGQIATKHICEPVPSRGGWFVPDAVYSKLCVIERHGRNGNVAVCPLKGYDIRGGAVATTVAHDSHNIIAAGDNDRDILLAVEHLRQTGGGYALAGGGRLLRAVPLPVAGLLSPAPWREVQQQTAAILAKARSMGIPPQVDPFITLSFIALPVIPSLRLTDRGLFDVERFQLLQPPQ